MTILIYLMAFLFMMMGGFMLHRLIMKFNPLMCLLIIIAFGSVYTFGIIGLIVMGAMAVSPYTPLLVMFVMLAGAITGLLLYSYRESRKSSEE